MKLATVLSAAGLVLASQLAMAAAPARIVSFDHGSLDTLDALGLGKQVVAVPKQAMPAYLSAYTGAAFNDAGSLKEPDIDALKAAEPSLILITGRQGGSREQLETVAPVRDVTLQETTTGQPSAPGCVAWPASWVPPTGRTGPGPAGAAAGRTQGRH
ncbi:hypothetical protein MBH78_03840 [Oceanimonas sp. NS1]|nr:hypothetical protein [Oceanimonas sp. NS1]